MKPACYVGIDAGTTYTKAVVLGADGAPGEVLRMATPTRRAHGATFFDLAALEAGIRGLLDALRERHELLGVSFTSVGESVVPVRDGRAAADALVWYDGVTEGVERRHREELDRLLPPARRGGASNSTFGVYKILWMREALGLPEPECWLPLSSYLALRFGGQARWDYSQASRTALLDLEAGGWSGPAVERFGLGGRLPGPFPMGTALERDARGTVYALGGHDHIAGLFAVRALMGGRPFLLDSTGSSESVVALTRSRALLSRAEGLCVGAAFAGDLYYALCSLRSSGTLLECLARLGGSADVVAHYEAMNAGIRAHRSALTAAWPLLVGGDPAAGERPRGFSLLNLPLDAEPWGLAHSAYLYLAAMARTLIERLAVHAGPEAAVILSGGATANRLYVGYRAAVLGRPLHLLEVGEFGGLGAALCAATARGDQEAIAAFVARQRPAVVEPDGELPPGLRDQAEALLAFHRARAPGALLDALE